MRRQVRYSEIGSTTIFADRGGVHKSAEQRMGTRRAALELGMALARNEPRVIGKLDHLSQAAGDTPEMTRPAS